MTTRTSLDVILARASAATRALNAAAISRNDGNLTRGAAGGVETRPARKQPKTGQMTQAESEWKQRLNAEGWTVTPHGVTLKFPDGDRYTPDLVAIRATELPCGGEYEWDVVYWEVKGGYKGPGWEQGYERYKRARQAFPWLSLWMAEKINGEWRVRESKPGDIAGNVK